MIKEGYSIASKYCIIKIENKYYVQKQGVIMGASFAPNFANLSILTHIIQNKIYLNKAIKLNLRMVDDTFLIISSQSNMDITASFQRYYPHHLQFTSENVTNNSILFLNIKFIKLFDSLNYIMHIKKQKLEFFTPFRSNHPMHMKINIVKNMVKRAVVLCSNKTLFIHTIVALKIRFQKSGYPDSFLLKYMNINEYDNRNILIKNLNNNRYNKCKNIIQQSKIKYKPKWVPNSEKRYISILHDNNIAYTSSYHQLKQYLQYKHPNKRILPKLNSSIQKIIRCKDAKYNEL